MVFKLYFSTKKISSISFLSWIPWLEQVPWTVIQLSPPSSGTPNILLSGLLFLFSVPHSFTGATADPNQSVPTSMSQGHLSPDGMLLYRNNTKRNMSQTHYCIPFITAGWPSAYVRRMILNSSWNPLALLIYSHWIRCESELLCSDSMEIGRHLQIQARKNCTTGRHWAEEVCVGRASDSLYKIRRGAFSTFSIG